MEAAAVADRVGHYGPGPASQQDHEFPPPEVGSVKDKVGRFGTNSLAVRPKDALDKPVKDTKPPTLRIGQYSAARPTTELSSASHEIEIDMKQVHSTHTKESADSPKLQPLSDTANYSLPANISQDDTQSQPKKPKPPIPRKPIMLAHSKPPGPSESPPMGHSLNLGDSKELSSAKNEQAGERSRSPRPYGYNKQSPSPHLRDDFNHPPPPEEFKPKLPPRSGTSSTDQSPSPHTSVNSLSDDPRPKLPPRRGASVLSRKPTRNQGIVLEDNESPSLSSTSGRSLNGSYPSLLDEPSIMNERRPLSSVSSSPLALAQASPAKVPPPPPPQRRTGLHSAVQPEGMGRGDISRAYTPPRNVQQPPRRSETQHDRNLITQPLHTVPHKYPGSDASNPTPRITEKEQKRYETVWAANKGLLIPGPSEPFYHMYPPGASDMVLNLVVRDIWSRSCLSNDVLLRVWDLVDRQDVRLLTRDEFIVGMWLIDQILMGNQLPETVPGSVWDSLGRSSDVNLI